MDIKTPTRVVIPAGHGSAFRLGAGERIRVIDVEGGQVGDVFAFAADNSDEHLSAAHTRSDIGQLFPNIGQYFLTTERRPILELLHDTSPGVHDMLIAACDPARYLKLGVAQHRSCADNLRQAVADLGLTVSVVPQPVNVFMNIPVSADGALRWLPAPSSAGDAITFAAAMDCVVVVSACPMDLNDINNGEPTSLAVEAFSPTTTQEH